jgi:hypothetical protein
LKINIKLFFIPFVFLFIVSCSLRTAKVSGPAEEPAKRDEGIQLLTKLNRYNEMVDTVEGNALTVYREEDSTISFKTEIVSDKKKQKFRIDLYDFVFKVPLLSIIRNNDDILAVVHNKKEYYRLTFEHFDFREMTGFDIPKEILVGSMTGDVHLIEGRRDVSSPEDLLLSIKGETGTELVRFNGDALPVEAQYIKGADIYTVKYEKYKNIDNIDHPYRILIKHNGSQLEINYMDIKLNKKLNTDLFAFDGINLEDYRKAN